jgi:hypothetical protein
LLTSEALVDLIWQNQISFHSGMGNCMDVLWQMLWQAHAVMGRRSPSPQNHTRNPKKTNPAKKHRAGYLLAELTVIGTAADPAFVA